MIVLVGFDGELSRLADHVFWVLTTTIGIREDAHQSVVHVLAQCIRTQAVGPLLPGSLRRGAGGKPSKKELLRRVSCPPSTARGRNRLSDSRLSGS